MKIGYFADGPWAHQAIAKILSRKDVQILFICLRYDNPDLILKKIAGDYAIPCFSVSNINSVQFVDEISKYNCDLFVSMSFNQIFRSSIRNTPPLGIINCHAGLLPFYRGRNVLNWALINDEKKFGVSVHYVDEGVDTGDIILQHSYPITDKDDYSTLLLRSYKSCAEILIEAIEKILQNNVTRQKQDDIHKHGTYCSVRKLGDEILNWNNTSRDIFNFVRAITTPGPCARTYIDNSEIKLLSMLYIPEAPIYLGIPGAILAKKDGLFLVKTLDSYIAIKSYVASIKLKVGDRFQ